MNLFRVARDHGEKLQKLLELTPFARDEFKESYEISDDPIEQARRTVVRSFMGFGSNSHNQLTGFRSCSNRSGTTPAHDWVNYPGAFVALIDRLRGVVIENRNASDVMLAHDSTETVHYVDPPYVFDTRDSGEDYRHELTDQDHIALADVLHQLNGIVVLSGYRNPIYDDLFSSWTRIDKNSHADGARARIESLWISPNSKPLSLFDGVFE